MSARSTPKCMKSLVCPMCRKPHGFLSTCDLVVVVLVLDLVPVTVLSNLNVHINISVLPSFCVATGSNNGSALLGVLV